LTLELAHQTIGDRPVNTISTGDVMKVLEPIWSATPESASRLRGRIEAVLDYAAARGWRDGDNPARWRGHLAKLLPSKRKLAKVQHLSALPWQEIGAFMSALRHETNTAARALEFAILTAARSGEATGARWREIDMRGAVWTVPAERMKAGNEHRTPLSAAALDVLRQVARAESAPDAPVFEGGRAGRHLTGMSMVMLLRRMQRGDLTVHGFRSTFRDWAAESTDYPREVAEAALAHTNADKVEAAYRRSDLFEKRRKLMEEWAAYCCSDASSAEAAPVSREVAAPS
jgi:integrase